MSIQKLYPLIKDGLYGLQDASGHTILSPKYDFIQISDDERLRYRHKDYWGLLDRNGLVTVSHTQKYDFILPNDYGYYQVSKGDKEGLIDGNGRVIIPVRWEECYNIVDTDKGFSRPLVIVMYKEKYGVIDIHSQAVIPFKYDDLFDDEDGLLIAELDGKTGVIDENGDEIIPFDYDSIYNAGDGLLIAEKDNLFGCIDLQNRVVIPFKYYGINSCGKTLLAVVLDEGRKKWNCIDRQGNLQFDQPCRSIEHSDAREGIMDEIILCLSKNGKTYYSLTPQGLQELPSDSQAVYSADGKTIIKRLSNSSKVEVKPGVEQVNLINNFLLSRKKAVTTISFLPGTTRIGKGWGDLSPYEDKFQSIDIYLPATINEIDPDAFVYLMSYIHAIYAPKEALNHILKVVPPYLSPLVKQVPNPWQRLLWKLSHLPNPVEAINDKLSFLGDIGGLILRLIAIFTILPLGMVGADKYEDTMLSYHISIFVLLPGIFGLAALGTLSTNNFNWRKLFKENIDTDENSKEIMSESYNTWLITLFCITSILSFILFYGNAQGEGEPQQVQAQIVNVETHNGKRKYKTIDMEFDIPPYHMSTDVNIKRTYEAGQKCNIFYHEGLFGWNVLDSIRPLN
ncbi:MAG: WG repeat-containing protein [Bacteroidales bacterium]|nr:WG repeat-containing protein [Bacteroidales bacterium]